MNEQQKLITRQENKSLLLGLMVGTITATVFGLGGYFLLRDRTGAMGGVLLLLLPVASGFAVALVTRKRTLLYASLLMGLLICAGVLLATGLEGFVCALMAAPLVAVGLAIGALAGALFRKYVLDKSRSPGITRLLIFLAIPFLLTGANSAEEPSRRAPRIEVITNTLMVDASPEVVWDKIKSVDSINAAKPFLMTIGLPVPTSCALKGEGVGGKRICYFDSGYIEETITEWNPPGSMKVEITAVTLPGRHWLTFKGASYDIRKENDHTIITRTTTIASRLYPAWYWTRLEHLGVETEHEYLFEEVKNRLSKAK